MRAIKIENNWRVLLIERTDFRLYSNRLNNQLEESLRGYLFSEIVIPNNIWKDFEESSLKKELDRLLRMTMRVKAGTKYHKLEDLPFLSSVEDALKKKDSRQISLH